MSVLQYIGVAVIGSTLIASANVANAEEVAVDRAASQEYETLVVESAAPKKRRYNAWSFAFDNDLLVPGSRDQDYTYGVSATLSSESGPSSAWSLDTSEQQIRQPAEPT